MAEVKRPRRRPIAQKRVLALGAQRQLPLLELPVELRDEVLAVRARRGRRDGVHLAQDLLEDAEEIDGGVECGYRLVIVRLSD